MEEWIALVGAAGPYLLGVAGIVGGYLTGTHQAASVAKADVRRRGMEAATQLLALAYQVKSIALSHEFEAETTVRARWGSTEASSAKIIDQAYELAAACIVAGDRETARAANNLAAAIEGQYYDFASQPFQDAQLTGELRAATTALEEALGLKRRPPPRKKLNR